MSPYRVTVNAFTKLETFPKHLKEEKYLQAKKL
jgi:hypothetical protein